MLYSLGCGNDACHFLKAIDAQHKFALGTFVCVG
jgi:hypothetical protein